jgi:NAD(P)-dependent dehydrogenase (short-subunit alcohol dehydrogenase family)
MRILVLGASSMIGGELARTFGKGNELVLIGRNEMRLASTARACLEAGASLVETLRFDLGGDSAPLLSRVGAARIDLMIDAASGTSGKRDPEISTCEIEALLQTDLNSRIALLNDIESRQGAAPPSIIFVSTILALVRSPDRVIYASIKQICEGYLRIWQNVGRNRRLLIVYVGTLIDKNTPTPKAARLAAAVFEGFKGGKESIVFGTSGRAYVMLYNMQPIVFRLVTAVQRRLRRK